MCGSFPWLESFQIASSIAALVAAAAALVTIALAKRTVDETRAMRQEERLARVSELVGEFGVALDEMLHAGTNAENRVQIAELRLSAALDALREELPACRKLIGARVDHTDAYERVAEILAPAFAELQPLHAVMAQVNAEG